MKVPLPVHAERKNQPERQRSAGLPLLSGHYADTTNDNGQAMATTQRFNHRSFVHRTIDIKQALSKMMIIAITVKKPNQFFKSLILLSLFSCLSFASFSARLCASSCFCSASSRALTGQ